MRPAKPSPEPRFAECTLRPKHRRFSVIGYHARNGESPLPINQTFRQCILALPVRKPVKMDALRAYSRHTPNSVPISFIEFG
jgi:hypothetical protein